MKNKTEKKVIVVTGGSSGIGKYLVEKFREEGNIVFSLARSNKEINDEFNLFCDVTDTKSVANAFALIEAKTKQVDTLVNCAGYGVYGATELIPQNEIRQQMEVNFDGIINVSCSCLSLMHEKSKIFNISSACALFPLPYRSVYCASKSAVNSLSFGMRMELKQFGIDVVAICPGDIMTNFTKNRKTFLSTNEMHGNHVEKSFRFVEDRNNKRMSEKTAGNIIKKICEKKKTKAMYVVGTKYKFFYLCSKFLPTNCFQKILNKLFNK